MQGNCATAPADATLPETMQSSVPSEPWVAGQCMVITSKPAFLVLNGNLWLDNLILAAAPDVRTASNSNVTLLEVRQTFQGATGSNLFVTNSVFKGDASGTSRAIAMSPQYAASDTGTPVQKFHSLMARGVCALLHSTRLYWLCALF